MVRRVIVSLVIIGATFGVTAPALACSRLAEVPFERALRGPRGGGGAAVVGFVERQSIASAPALLHHPRSIVMTTRTWGDVSDHDTRAYVTPFELRTRVTSCGPPDARPAGTYEAWATYAREGVATPVRVPDGLTPEQESRLERELGAPNVTEPGRAAVLAAHFRVWWPNALAAVLVVLLVVGIVGGVRRRVRRIDIRTGRVPA